MIEAGNVHVEGWAWGEGRGCKEVKDTAWWWAGGRWWATKKHFTHCSLSQAPVWKMHGTSVRNTIICMAQRSEAMRASLLDTSTQDAPTVQYSLTQQSLVQKEDSQARRELKEKKWKSTHTHASTNSGKCVSVRRIIYVIVSFTIITIITLM